MLKERSSGTNGGFSMSETVNLTIPFDCLLQAIAQLNTDDKQRLWEFLDEQLHDDEIGDAEEEAEVAGAYAEYEAGEFVTLDEYTSQRIQRLSIASRLSC
jgi:hypothetical protein